MRTYWQKTKWFVGLVLLQALVLNHIHVGGYATPFFFIYFILRLDSEAGRNELMAWAFFLGLSVDMFANTPGMNAAAATLLAFVRQPILRLVANRDTAGGFEPGVKSMGALPFFKYVLLCVLVFCAVLLVMDTFSFFDLPALLLKIGTDTLATTTCILCVNTTGGRRQ